MRAIAWWRARYAHVMVGLSQWRRRADARRSRPARFRLLLAEVCGECSHPWAEHLADAGLVGSPVCSECVYELEHGFSSGPICHRPVPIDVLSRADAAAAMAGQGCSDRLVGAGQIRVDGEDCDASSIATLREATAALFFGLVQPRDVIALAANLLAAGSDGVSLIALASLYSSATPADVFDLSSVALIEAGARPLDRDGDEIPLLALRVACRRLLDGDWDPRYFSSWVHDRIGHDGPSAAQPLVDIDDELDARGIGAGERYRQKVVRLAATFLADTEGQASEDH
ncbi:hypothetical protein C5C59_05200 [Rathayibacter sp. AY1F4]|nr:hypothetical protein C5C26_11760 [Rathayibacter sp. AY2B1]PPG72877.1 hypothetical protein C5C59_05200 [Rathayibacter sp. AY1F4]